MKYSRIEYTISQTLLVVGIILISSLSNGQAPNRIDIDAVKKDMIAFGNDVIPARVIERKENTVFNIFYIDKFCLVHLPHKDIASEAMMKSSIIALYEFQNKIWKFIKLIPYNYDLSMLNEKHRTFLSENLFCSSNGDCSIYTELAVFENLEMKTISSYNGFDRTRYYDGLFSIGKGSDVQKVIGDTVTSIPKLQNFIFNERGIKCYEQEIKIGVLVGISDSLTIAYKTKYNSVKIRN